MTGGWTTRKREGITKRMEDEGQGNLEAFSTSARNTAKLGGHQQGEHRKTNPHQVNAGQTLTTRGRWVAPGYH